MPKRIYIYGAGGHAKVVAATARLCGYEIAGFWEDSSEHVGKSFFGSNIISFESIPPDANIFIAFGDNSERHKKGKMLERDFQIVTIIHPSAQIADGVMIGQGCYIGALSNIDPGCIIEKFCIVNNGANISHDTILHTGCHICGGSQLAGHCSVGQRSMIGIGSCMKEDSIVGDDAIIGAGSTIINDIPAGVMAYGTPARPVKALR